MDRLARMPTKPMPIKKVRYKVAIKPANSHASFAVGECRFSVELEPWRNWRITGSAAG